MGRAYDFARRKYEARLVSVGYVFGEHRSAPLYQVFRRGLPERQPMTEEDAYAYIDQAAEDDADRGRAAE